MGITARAIEGFRRARTDLSAFGASGAGVGLSGAGVALGL